jgi:hypothetical protein
MGINGRSRSSGRLSCRGGTTPAPLVVRLGDISRMKITARLPGRTTRQCRERRALTSGTMAGVAMGARNGANAPQRSCRSGFQMASDGAPVPDMLSVGSSAVRHFQTSRECIIENHPKSYGRNHTAQPESKSQLAARIWSAQNDFRSDIEPDSQYSEFCYTTLYPTDIGWQRNGVERTCKQTESD